MGLLEEMEKVDNGKRYYMIGERPLNSNGGTSAFILSPKVGHHHFVLNDGIGNFGFAGDGEFSEAPSALVDYEPTKKYGTKRYEANMLDMARQHWHDNHDAIDAVADEMDLWDADMPNKHRDYHWLANNCQHYVSWLDEAYNRLKNQ